MFFCWAFLEFVNHLIGKWERLSEKNETSDPGSYWLLVVSVYICFCLAGMGRWLNWGVAVGIIQYVGLGLMVAGITLRQWAIVSLGQQFSVVIAIEPDHCLITRGPYRWLRHPAYTGGLIATIGFTLALGSGLSVIPVGAILLAAFSHRIRLEEELLLTTFGDTYRNYMLRTWRFLPGW